MSIKYRYLSVFLLPLVSLSALNDRYWEDVSVFELNTEPPQSPVVRPVVLEDGRMRPNESSSHRVHLLNGTWKFKLVEAPDKAPEGFEKTVFDDQDWSPIRVPSSWQTQGFGFPLYTNHGKPWSKQYAPPSVLNEASQYGNPTGCYRTEFELPEDWSGRRIILHFAGANSAMYAWLNGTFLGYSEDGFLPAEFDVTEIVQAGTNQLAVKVLRWSDGSYMETWDTWRISGIFRDVYLYETPVTHLRDFHIDAGLTDDLQDGTLAIKAKVRNASARTQRNLSLKYELSLDDVVIAEEQQDIAPIPSGGVQRVGFFRQIPSPLKWSAETPNLYSVRIELFEGDQLIESVTRKTGFRRVERRGNQMLVNGEAITIKGVNRVEIDPDYGQHVPYEVLLKDLTLMKQHNINTIRLAMAPHHPALFDLCDELGLYLINEVNNETNSAKITDNPEWTAVFLDRTRRLFERDKNHPSIIIWSLGNESSNGLNLRLQADWFRQRDPSGRLIQYTLNYNQLDFTDTFSQTYPSLRPNTGRNYTLGGMHNDEQPVILNEYAHSMGNATGNLKEYMALFEDPTLPGLQGGCIWDFVDQGLRVKPESGESYFDYGSQFGITYDGNFCINGLVFPDRVPQPALQEVKVAYQPLRVSMPESDPGKIVLKNLNFFAPIDSARYQLTWSLKQNGEEKIAGQLEQFTVPPRDVATLVLAEAVLPAGAPGEWTLDFTLALREPELWAPSGHVVAQDQIILRPAKPEVLSAERAAGRVTVEETESLIQITSEKSAWTFDKAAGRLASWRLRNSQTELIEDGQGPAFTPWRAPIDNDIGWSGKRRYIPAWFEHCTLGQLTEKVTDLDLAQVSAGQVRLVVKTELWDQVNDHAIFELAYHYNFMADGRLILGQEVRVRHDFGGIDLPRIGLSMTMPGAFQQVSWYGRGPHENYSDRQMSAFIGRYASTVDEFYVPYVKPQANGNRSDVREMVIARASGEGLRIYSPDTDLSRHAIEVFSGSPAPEILQGGTLQFTALPYSERQLESAQVTHQLQRSGHSYLTVDIAHAGVGNVPNFRLPEYTVPAQDIAFILVMEPVADEF